MRVFALACAAALLSACAAVTVEEPMAALRPAPDAAAASAPPAPSAEAPPPRRAEVTQLEIAHPTEVACALPSKRWSGGFELREGGAPFASVEHVDATLVLPRAGGAAAVDVRGPIDITAVVSRPHVFLAKPMALGDFVVPLRTTALDLSAPHGDGRMNVGLDVSDMFEAPSAVVQVVPCSSLTPVEASYDAHEFVRLPSTDWVGVTPFTDLRSSPSGPVVAKIARSPRGNIHVGASQGGARRLVLSTSRYVATGWVPARAVEDARRGFGSFGSRMGGVRFARSHATRCSEPLDVWAQIDGERARIGVMREGTRFTSSDAAADKVPAGFVAIELADGWLRMDDRALLLIERADAERCQRR